MSHSPFGADHSAVLENWNRRGFADRCTLLAGLDPLLPLAADHPEQRQLLALLLNRARHLGQTELLPGPTGESNELYCSGRGVVLVYGDDSATALALLGQLISALACGNAVLLHCPAQQPWCERIVTVLHQLGVPHAVLALASNQQPPLSTLPELLALPELMLVAPVIASTAQGAMLRTLAQRSGVLVQCAAETDPQECATLLQPDHLLRFVTEKTRTINTTAVGGNASLLELGANAH